MSSNENLNRGAKPNGTKFSWRRWAGKVLNDGGRTIGCVVLALGLWPAQASSAVSLVPQWSCHCNNITVYADTTGCNAVFSQPIVRNAICSPTCMEDPDTACFSQLTYTLSAPCTNTNPLIIKTSASCRHLGLISAKHNQGEVSLIVDCGECTQ